MCESFLLSPEKTEVLAERAAGRARREAITTCTQNADKEPTIVRRVTQHEEVVERFVIQASIALVCPHSSQETTSASN